MKILVGTILALGLATSVVAQQTANPIVVAQATSKGVLAKKLPLTRAELERVLIGRYAEQVVAMVGDAPRSTGSSVWVYNGLSINEATGKPDSTVYVYFDGHGKVSRLGY